MAEDIRDARDTAGIAQFEKQFARPYCLVLDSLYCSMGRMIAVRACQKSGYAYYDSHKLLELVNGEISSAEVEEFEERMASEDFNSETVRNSPAYKRISRAFDRAIALALGRGPLLIHDRAVKEKIQEKGYSCLSVLIYAENLEDKIVRARVSPLFADIEDPREIIRGIEKQDLIRRRYRSLQSASVYGDRRSYDLCINSDAFGRDFSAEILAELMAE